MKSVSICRLEPIDATATRSAGVICSSTHFTAPSAAFCTSSGCIELVSNTSTQMRWPATSSDVNGPFAASTRPAVAGVRRGVAGCAAGLGAATVTGTAPFAAAAVESIVALSTAAALAVISS